MLRRRLKTVLKFILKEILWESVWWIHLVQHREKFRTFETLTNFFGFYKTSSVCQ
jgi:hypothetical protein